MVQGRQGEPSMLLPRFMEGSVSRSEPSTPKTDIVDGTRAAGRTLHDNAPFHGRFSIQGEPSTVKADIMDGSILGSEPSMSKVDIMEGSMSESRNS